MAGLPGMAQQSVVLTGASAGRSGTTGSLPGGVDQVQLWQPGQTTAQAKGQVVDITQTPSSTILIVPAAATWPQGEVGDGVPGNDMGLGKGD